MGKVEAGIKISFLVVMCVVAVLKAYSMFR